MRKFYRRHSMRKIITALSICILAAASLFAADPAVGLWKSIDDETNEVTAVWSIYEENGLLFGKILAVADAPQDVIASDCKKMYKGLPVMGDVSKMHTVEDVPWIFNMQKQAEGQWGKGNIIDPDGGSMYGCVILYLAPGEKHKKFTAPEPTLAMAGTLGPIKIFQYWPRATQADIDYLKEKFPAEGN